MAGWWPRHSAERYDFSMKINSSLISGALKPEACPSQSLWVCTHTSVVRRPVLFLFLCSFTGGALVEVYLCLLVTPAFFIELFLEPASRKLVARNYSSIL